MTAHAPIQWPAVPKVTVSEHGVTCEDCQTTFRHFGTHFVRIHHIPGQRSRIALLRLFGLPQGTRMAAREHRELMSADAIRRGCGDSTARFRRGYTPRSHGLLPSAAQLANRVKLATVNQYDPALARYRLQVLRRAAITCEQCKFTFTTARCHLNRPRPRRYCSLACHYAAMRQEAEP